MREHGPTYSDLCRSPLRAVHRLGKFLGADVERREGEAPGAYVRRLRQEVALACVPPGRSPMLVLEDEDA